MRHALLLACLIAACVGADKPQTGVFTLTFDERHPDSAYERMAQRYGWGAPKDDALYDISKEVFDVNVPTSYDGTEAYGLIVYTNSGTSGSPHAYHDLLGKHKLIWIGAANVPNERNYVPRWALSLDAVWNMCKRYRIDPRRIYASGTSGGGRCASMVAPTYADVFSGAIYLIGCNPPMYPNEKPIGKPIRQLAQNNRYALMTGGTDFNKPGTKSLYDLYLAQGYKHVIYLEQPGKAHENPDPDWFEKGLMFVDQPLVDEANAIIAQAKTLEAKKPYEACLGYRAVLKGTVVAVEARATAKERLDALAPQVEELLRAELAKLDKAPKEKLRAFARRADGYPSGDEARGRADTMAGAELDAVLAQPGATTASKLEKFLDEWEGYPSAVRALEAYEVLAAKALESVITLEGPKRDKSLAKYCKDWKPCPSRERAMATLEESLATQLAEIEAIEKMSVRGPKLVAFVKDWQGTEAAAKAERTLKALVAEVEAAKKP